MTPQTETRAFEAEVRQVLDLVVHSLYTNREIFLRELISNASDALDKLRFAALTEEGLLEEGETLGIALEADADARVLRVADNGIGMTRDELVENLGTIASSGTRRFLAALEEGERVDTPELIGQFGVGFYSAFMVADEVVVETRRAGTDEGWRWRSRGDGEYSLESVDGLARGTVVELHLREPGEDGTDWTDRWALQEVVRRYSDFVEFPIQMEIEETRPKLDDEGKPIEGETELVTETVTMNSMKPLWARAKDELSDDDYAAFYRHLTHDWNDPRETLHLRAEGTLEYTALLFLPEQRPFDLFDPAKRESSVSLYVRRVMIQRECEDLLPSWLRFVRGVVECADLPLNVSRETLQDDPRIRQIRKHLVRKVLERVGSMLADDREAYAEWWADFGPVLKEGVWAGDDDEQRISRLCLWQTSRGDEPTTLAEYVERMPAGQESIHVLTGPDRRTAEASPHLEALRERGEEVLLLVDPVDEWVLQRLREWDGKPVVPIDRGDGPAEDDESRTRREERQKEHEGLLEAIREALDEDVSEVRFTGRLKDSPAVLVGDPQGLSGHMERLLRRAGQDVPARKRVLELNPDHPLVSGLKSLHDADPSSPRVAEYAELLHGQALVAEGGAPKDPKRFGALVTELMVKAVRG